MYIHIDDSDSGWSYAKIPFIILTKYWIKECIIFNSTPDRNEVEKTSKIHSPMSIQWFDMAMSYKDSPSLSNGKYMLSTCLQVKKLEKSQSVYLISRAVEGVLISSENCRVSTNSID